MGNFYGRARKSGSKKPKKKLIYKGITMASTAEINFAKRLDEDGIPWKYEPEKFKWTPPDKTYKPDFIIHRKNGTYFFVEYKGYLRTEDKTKMIAMKKQYPGVQIYIVFTNANGYPQGSQPRKDGTKQTNKEWAEKNGYIWAEKRIPDEWMEG